MVPDVVVDDASVVIVVPIPPAGVMLMTRQSNSLKRTSNKN